MLEKNIEIVKKELEKLCDENKFNEILKYCAELESKLTSTQKDNDSFLLMIYGYRIFSYSSLNDIDSVQTYAKKALELKPNTGKDYANLGNAKLVLGKYEAALVDFTKAIELIPNDANMYRNCAYIKSVLGKNEEAIVDYSKAIELLPNCLEFYFNRGVINLDLCKYEEAIIDFDKVIELDPNNTNAYNNRGLAKVSCDKYGQEEELIFEENVEGVLGSLSRLVNRYVEAIADYSKAIELDSNNLYFYENRGIAYLGLSEYENALSDFNKLLELDPNNIKAYYNRYEAYVGLKQYELAKQDLLKLLELSPNDSENIKKLLQSLNKKKKTNLWSRLFGKK